MSCVFPDRDFWGPFPLFSLCSGYPEYTTFRPQRIRNKSIKSVDEYDCVRSLKIHCLDSYTKARRIYSHI